MGRLLVSMNDWVPPFYVGLVNDIEGGKPKEVYCRGYTRQPIQDLNIGGGAVEKIEAKFGPLGGDCEFAQVALFDGKERMVYLGYTYRTRPLAGDTVKITWTIRM